MLTITVSDNSHTNAFTFHVLPSLDCVRYLTTQLCVLRGHNERIHFSATFLQHSTVVPNRYPDELAMHSTRFAIRAKWHEIRLCKITCVRREVQVEQAGAWTDRLAPSRSRCESHMDSTTMIISENTMILRFEQLRPSASRQCACW